MKLHRFNTDGVSAFDVSRPLALEPTCLRHWNCCKIRP